MKKRGQLYGDSFKYFLMAFIFAMIIIFVMASINKVRTTSCNTELILFEDELRSSIEDMYGEIGSVKEKNFNVPCNAEKIYFADLEKDTGPFIRSLYQFPFIGDYVKSNIEKNTFLVKDRKVIRSFYAGDINLEKPYFVCSDTSSGNLELYLGGMAASTEIVNKECGYDCTFELVNIDNETAENLLQNSMDNALTQGVDGFPSGTIDEEMENFWRTNMSVKIARRCNCGRKPGKTIVEILIKPEGSVKHFKLIEKIPKDIIDNLNAYLENMTGEYDYFKIVSDPLIMWHFNEISEETVIEYVLDKDILEYCGEVLKSVGLGVTVESEGVSSEADLDTPPPDSPLGFELPESEEIGLGETKNNVFGKAVWKFASDPDIAGIGKLKDYIYKISADGMIYESAGSWSIYPNGPYDFIKCRILEGNMKVQCEVGSAFSEQSHTFYIKVENPADADEWVISSFTVNVD